MGTSSLEISGSYGNANHQRPIEASKMEVISTYRDPETRPVSGNDFEVIRIENMCGPRPIGNSTMPVSSIENTYGARPVGPNIVDEEPKILMGYLD